MLLLCSVVVCVEVFWDVLKGKKRRLLTFAVRVSRLGPRVEVGRSVTHAAADARRRKRGDGDGGE